MVSRYALQTSLGHIEGLKTTRAHPLLHWQVYDVSAGKSLPQWLSDKKKKSLRKDEEFR